MVSMVVEAIDCVAEVIGDNRDEIGGRGGPFEMIRRSWEAEIACSVVTEAIEHVFEVVRVNRTRGRGRGGPEFVFRSSLRSKIPNSKV